MSPDEGVTGEDGYAAFRKFVADAPLYKRFDLGKYFEIHGAVGQIINYHRIFRWCDTCKTKTPFHRVDSSFHEEPNRQDDTIPIASNSVYFLYFACTGCTEGEFKCWIEAGSTGIRKVGQSPPWDISPTKEVMKTLEGSTVFYKRALECMSVSFGVGACTYMRRVLEEQINPILDAVLEIRMQDGLSEPELEKIRKMKSAPMKEKLQCIDDVIPDSVAVAGEKPLKKIYDRLSGGIHRRDEQECMEIATQVKEPLRYIVVRLQGEFEQREAKKRFDQTIKSIDLLD